MRFHATCEFSTQFQPLRHTKAMLLVDDGQRQVLEHHALLDDGVGAHHQRSLATLDQRQHGVTLFLLLAAKQPGYFETTRLQQRLQPADEFAEVLLGQDLGGRHQRTLPARVDTQRGGECGHHRFARTHVALQQPVHGHGPRQVGGDFVAHTALGGGELKRQDRQQLFVQGQRGGASGLQHRRPQSVTFAPRHQLRQLLGQQLFRLQALPRRVAVVFECGHRHVGCGVMQK